MNPIMPIFANFCIYLHRFGRAVYDWINRTIPLQADMESALNTLLAMKLLERKEEKFLIPAEECEKFEAFRKKKRKDKFDVVKMYFKKLPPVEDIPKVIELSDEEYTFHLKENRKKFQEAQRKLRKN